MNLARGDVDAARRWMTDRGLTADDEVDYVHEFEHLTVARTLLAAGSTNTRSDCSIDSSTPPSGVAAAAPSSRS